jgi:hypothetical protein
VQNRAFSHWAGAALMSAGVLTLLINAGLTPFLPRHVPFTETAVSSVFLWRQSASAVAVALLLFGSVGLYLREAPRARAFGAGAFAMAFLGSALVLGTEWNELFLVRDLALRAPDALRALDAGHRPSLYDLGAMIPLGIFMLGWIALAASSLRTGVASRGGAGLVIAGFFAIPLLSAALPGVWGAVLGNAILASGWFWLGYDLSNASALKGVTTTTS